VVRVASAPLLALFVLANVALAAPQKSQDAAPASPGEVQHAPEGAAVAPSDAMIYGPITSRDPEVRAQVKKLYLDQYNLDKATQAQLVELSTALQNESDPDFRVSLQKQMIEAKQNLQLKSMELGLEIARLNGDEARVAEYEKAIDQILHPEKYMPATLDPSVAKERARSMGLEN
jgi:hypothetical protein